MLSSINSFATVDRVLFNLNRNNFLFSPVILYDGVYKISSTACRGVVRRTKTDRRFHCHCEETRFGTTRQSRPVETHGVRLCPCLAVVSTTTRHSERSRGIYLKSSSPSAIPMSLRESPLRGDVAIHSFSHSHLSHFSHFLAFPAARRHSRPDRESSVSNRRLLLP